EIFCPKCELELRKQQKLVQDYFDENKEGTIEEAAEVCNAEQKYVKRWLKEGTVKSKNPLIECDGCKTLIYAGKLCNVCKQRCYDIISK
ncbi:MAG: hypothetical protein RR413_11305, partial [Christensenellaceae bacterium]